MKKVSIAENLNEDIIPPDSEEEHHIEIQNLQQGMTNCVDTTYGHVNS